MNPTTSLLVREAHTDAPRITASYAFLRERTVSVAGLSEAQIERRVALLVDIGRTMPRTLTDPAHRALHPEVVDSFHSPYEHASGWVRE
jgi:hypothetical protein